MGRGSRLAQALKSVWVGQHLAPLLYQRGKAAGELLLLSHAALEHLLGFLPVRVLSRVFRRLFLTMLRQTYTAGALTLEGHCPSART